MSKESSITPGGPGASLVSLELHEVTLRRMGPWPEDDDIENYAVHFILGAARLPQGRTGAELGVRIEHSEVAEIKVSYRAVFERAGNVEVGDEDSFWRAAVSRLAPVVIFPFVRETVSSLAARAGNPNMVLPVLNVGMIFKPEEVEFSELIEDGETDESSG